MAAFSASENFDSYTNLDPLGGLSGGSGWAAAWSANQGTGADIVSNSQFINSPNSVSWTGAGVNLGPLYNRQMSSAVTGDSTTVHVAMWISDVSSTDGGYWEMYIGNSALNQYCVINLNVAQGKIQCRARTGTVIDLLTGISSNTWYHCYLELDVTNQRCRGYASDTIPNAPVTMSSYSTGTFTGTIDYVWISTETKTYVGTSYLDDIRDVGTDFTAVGGASRDARNLALLGVG